MVHRRRRPPGLARALLAGGLLGLGGCAWAPRTQLEDCRQLSQGLRAEVARQADEVLKLRAHNRDLADRAAEDAGRLQTLAEANRRYEQVIADYQRERERLVAAFEELRRRVQAAADPVPTALNDRLRTFADSHPGCAFDPSAPAVTLPASAPFRPGSDALTPAGSALLRDLAVALAGPDAAGLSLTVVAPAPSEDADSSVRLASLPSASSPPDRLGPLRALRVRETLRAHSGLAPAQVEALADDSGPAPDAGRIAIRLRRLAPGADRQDSLPGCDGTPGVPPTPGNRNEF